MQFAFDFKTCHISVAKSENNIDTMIMSRKLNQLKIDTSNISRYSRNSGHFKSVIFRQKNEREFKQNKCSRC